MIERQKRKARHGEQRNFDSGGFGQRDNLAQVFFGFRRRLPPQKIVAAGADNDERRAMTAQHGGKAAQCLGAGFAGDSGVYDFAPDERLQPLRIADLRADAGSQTVAERDDDGFLRQARDGRRRRASGERQNQRQKREGEAHGGGIIRRLARGKIAAAMETTPLDSIAEWLAAAVGAPIDLRGARPIGGGCIHDCYRIEGGDSAWFVKINAAAKIGSLRGEYLGLSQLSAAGGLRVPAPLAVGLTADGKRAALAMEWLDLGARAGIAEWRQMGAGLARLHDADIGEINRALRARAAPPESILPEDSFGCRIANATLGDEPGFVGEDSEWADFFCARRLDFQFRQCEKIRGRRFALREKALAAARRLLPRAPKRSLLHGDLWSGNVGFAQAGEGAEATIFDPAPLVGDGEFDLAMTELFGGFAPAFYDGYRAARAIDDGYAQRRTAYQLFHILNHYNLFGDGYLRAAESMIADLARAA